MSSSRARAAGTVLVLALVSALIGGVPALAAGNDPTSTSVVCSPSSVTTDAATTCTATVTDTAASPSAPAGTVSFASVTGGTFGSDGTCPLVPSTTEASTCGVSFTPASGGGFPVDATYAPTDTVHQVSAGATGVTAVDPTVTTVSCPPTGATVGDAITCTATVSDSTSGGLDITGSISFGLSPDAPGSLYWTCGSSGTTGTSAVCTVTFTPPQTGSYALTASYGGDTYHAASAGTASIAVQSGASTESTPLGSTSLAESGAGVLPTDVTSTASGPSLGLVALDRKATLATHHRVGLTASCTVAAGGGCDGTVALYLKVVAVRKAAKGTTRTTVVVDLGTGKLALRLTGKKGAKVNVTLSRTGARLIRALLAKHLRSVKVTALVRQAGVGVLDRVLSLSLVTHEKHAKKHTKKHRKHRKH